MKRYIMEMANHFEKLVPESLINEVINVRNNYYCGFMTEIDAIRKLLELYEGRENNENNLHC